MRPRYARAAFLCLGLFLIYPRAAPADDWPMYGRDATRNAVSPERHPPTDWQVRTAEHPELADRNVKWKAALGSVTFGSPVVAHGLVWVCSNNEGHRDPAFTKDASCLMCFRESDGQFLWQRLTPREGGRVHDWPYSSVASPPLVEGDRLWYLTNRWEVVCLDIGPLVRGTGTPRDLWSLDLQKDLGVFGHCPVMSFNLRCTIGASYRGLIYVITGNGVDDTFTKVPAPDAPSLVGLEKDTGKVVWTDHSPGKEILENQCASPLVVEVNGRGLVVAPQGDGWVRAFDALSGELVWKFDANPKDGVWPRTRNEILATPVLYDGRVYVATGQGAEHGQGQGVLWCIDPTKQGDVSPELDDGPVDAKANGGPRKGVRPNPNSAAVWKFDRVEPEPGKRAKARDGMGRTCCSVAAADGLVIAPDFNGYVHCLDAKTGQRLWTHDAENEIYGAPLICDGKVFVATEGGDVRILALAREEQLLARHDFGQWVGGGPVFANGVLFVAAHDTLYAIHDPNADKAPAATNPVGEWPQWRGPARTNVSTDTGLLAKWPAEGPPLLWRARGLGEGVPSVAVSRGRVYALGYREGSEFLTARDVASGHEAWAARVGPAVAEQPSMRWLSQRTPTVDDDRVYAFSARGELVCFATQDGREQWRLDYVADLGGKPGVWGYCDFPLVDGGRLICTPGGARGALVAVDKRTGDVLWRCAVPDCERGTYSATVAAELGGVRQYVQQFDRGAAGVSTDGKLLWRYDGIYSRSRAMGNVHTAVPCGDDAVFCSGGWGAGGAMLKVTRKDGPFEVAEQYRVGGGQAFPPWLGNSSLVGRHLYTNAGFCIDLASGQVAWRVPEFANRTTVVVADGHLYFRLTDGTVVLAEANPERYVEVSRFLPPRATKEPAWTSPVIAGGLLYLRDQDELLCYDLRKDRTPLPAVAAAATGTTAPASSPRPTTRPADGNATGARRGAGRDAIFVPTPQDVVERMLELAGVTKGDVVYDLGCGDGRIVVTAAARYGCRAVGLDTDPECVRLSKEGAARQKVGQRVTIEQKDLFEADLAGATVVTLYLGRDVNRRLIPQLQKLKPGARVVSHNFDIDGYPPDRVVEMVSAEDDTKHTLYVWTAPLRKKD